MGARELRQRDGHSGGIAAATHELDGPAGGPLRRGAAGGVVVEQRRRFGNRHVVV